MGQGDFDDRVSAAARPGGEREPDSCAFVHDQLVYLDPAAAPRDVPQAVPSRADPGVLLVVPQGAPRRAGERATAGSAASTTTTTGRRPGVSGEGARSFYYPPKSQKCADCHMPLVPSNDPAAKNGMVRSHRFAAANTALPFVNGDAEQLKAVQEFLRDGQISVDIFGLVRGGAQPPRHRPGEATSSGSEPALASTFAVGEESMNFGATAGVHRDRPPKSSGRSTRFSAVVRRGESVRLEVVVRTRKVGHFFPGGTVDAFDVWVELEAVDDRGRVILHSGARRGRRQADRSSPARTSTAPAARRARQPDQQAQRVGRAIGRLRHG